MPALEVNVTLLCALEDKFVTIQISHWSRSMTTKFSSVEKDWHGLAAFALKALERAVKEEGGYSVYLGLLYYCLEGPVGGSVGSCVTTKTIHIFSSLHLYRLLDISL